MKHLGRLVMKRLDRLVMKLLDRLVMRHLAIQLLIDCYDHEDSREQIDGFDLQRGDTVSHAPPNW